MTAKSLLFEDDARIKLAKGAGILAKAVVSTLGPRSRNVAIALKGRFPWVIHDGVNVARSITLKDPHEAMGADLLKEAASKTNDLAGDGTTTATLLANYLFQEGLKITGTDPESGIALSKINPMKLKEELDKYADIVCEKLDKEAIKLKKKDIKKIAKIASNSDEIAGIVEEVINKVGADGMIMVDNSSSFNSSYETQKGMDFDNGYLSPFFATDPHRMTTNYPEAYFLLTDYVISDPKDITPIIQKVMDEHQKQKALVIIAGDVVGAALQLLVNAKLREKMPLVAVVAPEYADRRKEVLQDIAVLTGGRVFAADANDDLKKARLGELGQGSALISNTNTLLTPKYTDEEELNERIEAIKEQAEAEENAVRKEKLELRLARLSQSVAVIKVGGSSESEVNEKRERFIDSVHAVKAALIDGIVPGGGVVLRDIANELEKKETSVTQELVVRALRKPYEQILENSSLSDNEDLDKGFGIDVISGDKVNMIESGVIDPAKVTKLAIRHSFSVAGMMLTTDTLIADDADDNVQSMKIVQ